jgi:hypothetical protein
MNPGSCMEIGTACWPIPVARHSCGVRTSHCLSGRSRCWKPGASGRIVRRPDSGAFLTADVFVAVLAAAFMHAGWNALIKIRLDPFLSISLMSVGMGAISVACLPFVAVPAGWTWVWIGLSVALHVGYKLFLVSAYKQGDLGQVYPLARGTAPLITALGSAVLVGEVISPSPRPQRSPFCASASCSCRCAAPAPRRNWAAPPCSTPWHLGLHCRLHPGGRCRRPQRAKRLELHRMAVPARRLLDGVHLCRGARPAGGRCHAPGLAQRPRRPALCRSAPTGSSSGP